MKKIKNNLSIIFQYIIIVIISTTLIFTILTIYDLESEIKNIKKDIKENLKYTDELLDQTSDVEEGIDESIEVLGRVIKKADSIQEQNEYMLDDILDIQKYSEFSRDRMKDVVLKIIN